MTAVVATRRRVETVATATLLAAALVLYLPVLRDLVAIWRDVPYYSYGFLVPVFSGYLVWEARRTLTTLVPAPAPAGLLVLCGALTLLAAGTVAGSLSVRTLSLPIALVGIVLATQGVARTRCVAFALGFLALITPLPEGAIPALSLPLQQLAAVVTEHTLRALGAPVARHDLYVALPSVVLHVTEACNGLRFLLAMVVVGVAFAGTTQRRLGTRVAVVAAALAIGLAANLVRVTGTGVLALVWGPGAALGLPHQVWGKTVYAIMLLPFVAVVLMLRRR
jgi:exosortase